MNVKRDISNFLFSLMIKAGLWVFIWNIFCLKFEVRTKEWDFHNNFSYFILTMMGEDRGGAVIQK